jgi:GTPase Era involved in 16S rRNA processing
LKRRKKEKMDKKVLSDLEKMNKSREEQAKAFMEQKEETLEVFRITQEGINGTEELLTYLVACVKDAAHMEDVARSSNNSIMYSEAVAVRREFSKLLKLLFMNTEEENFEETDGTEENFRKENEGEEGYV